MLRDSGRARYVAVTDDEALARVPRAVAARGDRPGARERARDRLAARRGRERPAALDLVDPSGRGDKDLAEALAGLEALDRPMAETGVERIAAAFAGARSEGRAALMPYLMGGFPDMATSRPSSTPTPTPAPT